MISMANSAKNLIGPNLNALIRKSQQAKLTTALLENKIDLANPATTSPLFRSNFLRYLTTTRPTLKQQASDDNCQLLKTPFYDFHVKNNGKMVDFAGWSLPSSYHNSAPIMHVCKNVRTNCGLFDVSHMQKIIVEGEGSVQMVDYLTTCDTRTLEPGRGVYCLFLDPQTGGIYDDAIVNRLSDSKFYIVTNAGCASKIESIMKNYYLSNGLASNTRLEFLQNYGLLALQGPKAWQLMKTFIPEFDFDRFYFMDNATIQVGDMDLLVTRCGYTGEDGFEILVRPNDCDQMVEQLLRNSTDFQIPLQLSGLIARDILRIEAGLCLYGNDIDESTSPVEAVLMFTLAKSKRERMDFSGAQAVADRLKISQKYLKNAEKIDLATVKKRFGFVCSSKIPRNGHELVDEQDRIVGHVTSGTRSFELNKNIGIGYVDSKLIKNTSAEIYLKGAGRDKIAITQVPTPFLPTKYYTRPKN